MYIWEIANLTETVIFKERSCLHKFQLVKIKSYIDSLMPYKRRRHVVDIMTATLFVRRYSDDRMSAVSSQITGISMVCSTVCSGTDQRKHQSSALLAFVRWFHRWSVNSPDKKPVTRKMFPFDDVIHGETIIGPHNTPVDDESNFCLKSSVTFLCETMLSGAVSI